MKCFKTGLLFFVLFSSLLALIACEGYQANTHHATIPIGASLQKYLQDAKIPELKYNVITSYPHNTASFTEGLQYENGSLYESIGLYGRSNLYKVELNTGKIMQQYKLPSQNFAEGMTILSDKIYQLTYKEQTGFVYDKKTFALKEKFTYSGQGWGLTTDGSQLIMSNGSSIITFLDPIKFTATRTINVNVNGNSIRNINELEYINGNIFANVWPTDVILVISPQNGLVKGWLDLQKIHPKISCMPTDCVANGIAYIEQDDTLLLTGKRWPYLYAVKIVK